MNTVAADVFNARLAQANLNELKKLKTFVSSYFIGKSDFEEDGTQNYLVFQPMYRYFKRVSGVGDVSYLFFWKTKGYSNGNITAPFTSDYKLNLELIFLVLKPK